MGELMVKKKELEIHTVIVDGNATSFRAALSRSLLGVTWVKFKRRKDAFYRYRVHNSAIAKSLFNWLYESLLTNLRNLRRFKLKTDLKPRWNKNGKIEAISNVTVSVYLRIGELNVEELRVHEKFQNVKMEFFYSKDSFPSEKLRSELPSIIKSLGEKNFDYDEYEFSSKKGKKMAEAYGVRGTPTIVLNAEDILENPDKKKLHEQIEGAFAPAVKPIGKSRFAFDPELESTLESLTSIVKIKA